MADCLKIGVFAIKLLMGLLFHKVEKRVNWVSKSFLYNFERGGKQCTPSRGVDE
jgi:hypothetical protein